MMETSPLLENLFTWTRIRTMPKRGRRPSGAINEASSIIDDFLEVKDRELTGTVLHHRAEESWSDKLAEQHEDMTIEELLTDKEFFGKMNIWPAVRESLTSLWHRRYDYEASFLVADPLSGKEESIALKDVYALNHPHAMRRVARMWPVLTERAGRIVTRKKQPLHTVCLEMPRGTGKDFEMSLMVVLLVRDLLVMREDEFYPFYEISRDTRISVNLMNKTEPLAKRVTFAEVMPKFNIPFFTRYFPPANVDLQKVLDEKDQPGELRFPRNVVVFPGTGAASSNLGYALAALVLDECNNMQKNRSASQSIAGEGESTGDVAEDIYLDGLRRIESRLGQYVHGEMEPWGFIICLSQSRTAQDFTKRLQQKSFIDDGIVYKNFAFWERKPLNLSGIKFQFDTRTFNILDLQKAQTMYKLLQDKKIELFEERDA
jgi:hypothetical protein